MPDPLFVALVVFGAVPFALLVAVVAADVWFELCRWRRERARRVDGTDAAWCGEGERR